MTEKSNALKVEIPEVSVATTSKNVKKEELVDISCNQEFKIMYGNKWYYFKVVEVVKVPKELKDYLAKQGALAVL